MIKKKYCQVSHLETLRDNLDLNVEEKTSLLASLRDELAAFRAQTEIEKVNSYLNAHVLSLSLSRLCRRLRPLLDNSSMICKPISYIFLRQSMMRQ